MKKTQKSHLKNKSKSKSPVKSTPRTIKNKPVVEHCQSKIYTLSKNLLKYLFSFLTMNEQIYFSKLSSYFQNAYVESNNLNLKTLKYYLSFMKFYFYLEEKSTNYNEYINTFLNINIVHVNYNEIIDQLQNLSENEEREIDNCKLIALTQFINYRYKITNNSKFFIYLDNLEDYLLYEKLIPNISNYEKLKYYLNTSQNKELKDASKFYKLFTLIPHVVVPSRNNYFYSNIQKYIFDNKIDCKFYKIYSTNLYDSMTKYFELYPNRLECVINQNQFDLIKNNEESIKKISSDFAIDSFHDKIKIENLTNLEKISFNYVDITYNEFINDKFKKLKFLDKIKEIGGFNFENKSDIDSFIELINTKMKSLEKIKRIQFGEDTKGDGLFEYFIDKVNKNNKINKFTVWFYVFKKDNNYSLLLQKFPNIKCITEDYDCSGLYDFRLEIDKIFSCNAEGLLSEKDNQSIVNMLKNYLNSKPIGSKFFSFNLYVDLKNIKNLIKYAFEKNENDLLNSIHTINLIVGGGEYDESENEFTGLKRMNYFELNRDNESLINYLTNIEQILVIEIMNVESFKENYKWVQKVSPICIAYSDKSFKKEIFDMIGTINSVKFVIVQSKLMKDNLRDIKQQYNYKFILNTYK